MPRSPLLTVFCHLDGIRLHLEINKKMEIKQVNIDYEQYTGMTVNGITNVPDQIIELGKRLIRVEKNSKKPLDLWSEVSRDITNEQSFEHLRNNGNYGVKTGDGLVVVDLDSHEMVAKKEV